MSETKKIIYASYDAEKNGSFNEAIAISNKRGCVTWFDAFRLNPDNVDCPTDIIIRISDSEEYYRGTLLAIARAEDLGQDFAQGERNHRPQAWQRKDGERQTVETVFFINGLQADKSAGKQVTGHQPPQHPIYI
jgi:hypothetical protein